MELRNSPSKSKTNVKNKQSKSPERYSIPNKNKYEVSVSEPDISTPKIKTTSNNLLSESPTRKNFSKNFSIFPQPKNSSGFLSMKKNQQNFGKFNSISPKKSFKNSSHTLNSGKSKDSSYLKSPMKKAKLNKSNFQEANQKSAFEDSNKKSNKNNNENDNENNENEEKGEEEEENEEEEEELEIPDEPQIESEFDKELLAAFREVDEDGSGTISKEEFGNFMRKLGYRPTIVELQEMIDEIDKDKSGQIGFDEFKIIMTKTIKDEFTINSSIEAFGFFDKNKTEKFNKATLLNTLLTKGDNQYSESELSDLLKYVNFDENDEFNYRELILETFNSFNG